MSLTINAVKYFALGGVTSAGDTEGYSWKLSHVLIRKINPSCSTGRGPDWGRCPIPNRLLNTGYILSSLSLLQQVQHVSARYLPIFSQLEFHPVAFCLSVIIHANLISLLCGYSCRENFGFCPNDGKMCPFRLPEADNLSNGKFPSGRNTATAFFRDVVPLQMTQHYTPETKTQNFFKTSWTKKWALIPNYTHKYNSG